ncbi:hypothetical protein MPSEU_000076700 [Mayamaea pseudoterrestris]|nr:hypothetical protein MPSEU_000076700 [Mayamaea pseudoterrestris]
MPFPWENKFHKATPPIRNNPSPSSSDATTDNNPQWNNRPTSLRANTSDISTNMMDDILSPDSEVLSERFFSDVEQDIGSGSFCQSEASADSIIKRVEQEIAAARLAAAANAMHVHKPHVATAADPSAATPRIGSLASRLVDDEILGARSFASDERRTAGAVGEEFQKEFNDMHRDDQISLFSGGDEFSAFDYFADEFKDCGDQKQQHIVSPIRHNDFTGIDDQSLATVGTRDIGILRSISPATTVETIPARHRVPRSSSWESFDRRGGQENVQRLDERSLNALSATRVDEEINNDKASSDHDAASIGTSLGGTRNAQRARAILDTLKERRETFKSVFLTSNSLNRSPPPELPLLEGAPLHEEMDDEKKEDDSNLHLVVPWNCPVIEELPEPVVKPPKKKEPQPEPNLESKAEAKVKEVEETINRKSRRIRFRDTFPVIKPPNRPRVAAEMIAEHALGTPDFPIRWVRPKSDLRQLIVAAMGNSLARRSNACGALKVLTGQKKNQLTLARTDSFLEALVFAANQDIPINDDHELALTARTRAIACLKNVCEPRDNRIHVLMHAGNMECFAKVIREDRGEARALACMALAFLAKTAECREPMASMEGLLSLLAGVLKGDAYDQSLDKLDSFASKESELSHSTNGLGSYEKSGSASESEDSENEHSHSQHDEENDSRGRETDDESISSDNSTLSEASTYGHESRIIESKERLSDQEHKTHKQKVAEKIAEFLPKARSNACAVLLHLSKHCAVSSHLCSDSKVVESLVQVAGETENQLHSKCLEIISNLTRFPSNTSFLTRYAGLVEILIEAADSPVEVDRIFALRSLQNMSADSSSKALLATEAVLSKITVCALRNKAEEREASVAFLYNVSTEPGAVVAITNTKNVVATLVHLAHHPDSSTDIRIMACDALATISLWLQTLAGTGRVPKDLPNIPLPSHKTSGWNRWE